MLENINTWLEKWEPLWLFLLISLEALSGLSTIFLVWWRLSLLASKKSSTPRKKKEAVAECPTKDDGSQNKNGPRVVDTTD